MNRHAKREVVLPPSAAPSPPLPVPHTLDGPDARLERIRRLDGPRYASISLLAAGALVAAGLYRFAGLTPTALPWMVYGVLTLTVLPWLIFGWLSFRATLERFRLDSSTLYWIEERLELDLNHDDHIGAPPAAPRDDWFATMVKHWYAGGNTAKHPTLAALKLDGVDVDQRHWTMARDALLAAGLAMTVAKPGGMGFEIKNYSWDRFLASLPATPEVTQ